MLCNDRHTAYDGILFDNFVNKEWPETCDHISDDCSVSFVAYEFLMRMLLRILTHREREEERHNKSYYFIAIDTKRSARDVFMNHFQLILEHHSILACDAEDMRNSTRNFMGKCVPKWIKFVCFWCGKSTIKKKDPLKFRSHSTIKLNAISSFVP